MNTLRIPAVAAVALIAACSGQTDQTGQTGQTDASSPAGATTAAPEAPASPGAVPTSARDSFAGTVVETMDAASYTYLLIDTGTERVWAAGPQTALAVGDQVQVQTLTPMANFSSKTLGRTFDKIYFVAAIVPEGGAAKAAPAGHGAMTAPAGHGTPAASSAADLDLSGLAKVEGGHSLEEVFASQTELVGTEITFRGKVVKYNAGILGKNWLHVQDGTGAAGSNDLTVTTDATASVGDTVVVKGKLVADKDFGYGYKYALIVEDAQVTIE